MGSVYVLDAGDFRKVGKTTNFESRKASLLSEYKLSEFKSEWVSDEFGFHDSAEAMAHFTLNNYLITGEKFSAKFEECVKACMGAISRSESQYVVGSICGLDVVIDPVSGFINATKFLSNVDRKVSIHQFLKNASVSYMNDEIVRTTGQPVFFSTRGAGAATFLHPLIFIELNRSLSARHKVQVYLWMLNEMREVESIKKCLSKTLGSQSDNGGFIIEMV